MPRNVHNFKSDIGDGVFLLEQSADWNRAKKFKVGESISTHGALTTTVLSCMTSTVSTP